MLRPLALTVTLACSGCGGGLFACISDEDCQGGATAGICAEAGACSFPDEACESGQRYGDHAGDLSGHCVPVESTTSSASAGTSSSTSPTSLDVSSSPGESADTTDASAGTTTMPLGTSTTDVDPTVGTDTANDESSTGSVPADPDLLVWLRFEEDDREDPIANDGVLGGTASCVDGCPDVSDGLAEFDGLDDCLSFPSHAELVNTPFTAAAWVWSKEDDVGMFLFGKSIEASSQNSWELYISYELVMGQQLGFEMYGPPDVAIAATPPVVDQWTHVAGTWDGSALTLFADGEVIGETVNPASTFDDHDLRFACDDDTGVNVYFFEGYLDDMRIYGRALTPLEIADLAETPPPPAT